MLNYHSFQFISLDQWLLSLGLWPVAAAQSITEFDGFIASLLILVFTNPTNPSNWFKAQCYGEKDSSFPLFFSVTSKKIF